MEIAYFASSVVLLLVAIAGLMQLVIARRAMRAAEDQIKLATEAIAITREDIRIRVKREAVTVAAEQCAAFANTIPECSKHIDALQQAGFPYQLWSLRDMEFTWSSLRDSNEAEKWLKNISDADEPRRHAVAILNKMEAFAIYFARGAADEEVAYPVVGPVFCRWAEAYAPLLIALHEHRLPQLASGAYHNTIALYRVWAGRTSRERLQDQAAKIDKQLSAIPKVDVKPIGA